MINTTGLTSTSASNFGFAFTIVFKVLCTFVTRAEVADAIWMVSPKVRLADDEATLVPDLMSSRSAVLSIRRGMTSASPASPLEKSATVLLSLVVEVEILLMAARMEAPSARTVVARRVSGRIWRRIFDVGGS